MIVTKPKFNAFFALGMFLMLTYGSAIYLLTDILAASEVSVWIYVLLGFVLIIGLFVTIKMFGSYKKVVIDKKRVDVYSIFGLAKKRMYLKDLKEWKEESVKTANGIFKQLEVNFANKKYFRIANQEHDNYEKAANFFRKNYKKNEVKSAS